ncbi:MAG: hypothetical protein ABIJ47_04745 [Candidatus Bathyarchaeota archaeon]
MSSPQQPAKPTGAETPEITEVTFSLKDLLKLAEGCSSLTELNKKLEEATACLGASCG